MGRNLICAPNIGRYRPINRYQYISFHKSFRNTSCNHREKSQVRKLERETHTNFEQRKNTLVHIFIQLHKNPLPLGLNLTKRLN